MFEQHSAGIGKLMAKFWEWGELGRGLQDGERDTSHIILGLDLMGSSGLCLFLKL